MRSSTALSDLSGGVVVQARVWSGLVMGAAVLLDEDRGFVHGKERLLVETLVPEAAVKALAHAILPRLAGVNVGRRDALPREPPLNPPGDEFRPIVAAQILRRAAADHQLREDRQDAIAGQRARHGDREALLRELVDHGQVLEGRAVRASIVDEVI